MLLLLNLCPNLNKQINKSNKIQATYRKTMLALIAEVAGFRVALGFWGVAVPGVPGQEESLVRSRVLLGRSCSPSAL